MPKPMPEHVRKLFAEPNVAHIATLMPDGSPQVTPVWIDVEGDRLIVNSAEGRVKPANVRRDPRVAISVTAANNPYEDAWVRGRVVEVTHEGADETIDRLSKKYLGQDEYPLRRPDEQRVTFIIEPESAGPMTR